MLNDFNATTTGMKRQDDSSAFEKQAEIIGDEIAVVCGKR